MRLVWRHVVRLSSGACLVLVLLATHTAVLAQSADQARPSLSAPQPRVQVTLAPGAAAEGEVRFLYDGTEPAAGRAAVIEYRIGPDGESIQPPSEQGPGRWITLNPPTQELRPNTPASIRYRIEVPTDTPPGDHSALIVMETDPAGGRAAVRLAVNVPGEALRQAELLTFGAQRQPLRLFLFELPNSLPLYDSGPIQLRGQVRNAGTVQIATSGVARVIDLFGNEVRSFDLPAELVYPGDTRTFSEQWTYVPPLGWFTARLAIDAGGIPIVAEERLLVLPWQALLGFLLVLLAIRTLLGPRMAVPVSARRPVEASAPSVAVAALADAESTPTLSATREPASSPVAIAQPTPGRLAAEEADDGDQAEELDSADGKVGTLAAAWMARGTRGGGPLPKPESEQQPEQAPTAEPAPGAAKSAAPLSGRGQIEANGLGTPTDVLELLQLGQQAARSGDRETAYRYFVRALKVDPDNEEAWLWRAGTCDNPQESMRSLEQVLIIDPNNARARRGLEELQRRFARG